MLDFDCPLERLTAAAYVLGCATSERATPLLTLSTEEGASEALHHVREGENRLDRFGEHDDVEMVTAICYMAAFSFERLYLAT